MTRCSLRFIPLLLVLCPPSGCANDGDPGELPAAGSGTEGDEESGGDDPDDPDNDDDGESHDDAPNDDDDDDGGESGGESGDESGTDGDDDDDAGGSTGDDFYCGDGITLPPEVCDDRSNDGSYGGCAEDCSALGPFCGDGIVQPEHEVCDAGFNGGMYGGCNPGCQELAPSCGDGVLDLEYETCDDGNNDDGDNCNADCSPTGALIWSHAFAQQPGVSGEAAVGVAAIGDGRAVFIGRNADGGEVSSWVARIDVTGELQWHHSLDSVVGAIDPRDIAADGENVRIVGDMETASGDTVAWSALWTAAGVQQGVDVDVEVPGYRGVAVGPDGSHARVGGPQGGISRVFGYEEGASSPAWTTPLLAIHGERVEYAQDGTLRILGHATTGDVLDLVMLDASGEIEWVSSVEGFYGHGLVQRTEDHFEVVAQSLSDPLSRLYRFDEEGDSHAIETLEGAGYVALDVGPSEERVLVGQQDGAGVVTKLDSSGDVLWSLSLAGVSILHDVAVGEAGTIFVAGVGTDPGGSWVEWVGAVSP